MNRPTPASSDSDPAVAPAAARLSLLDAMCIMVGIIIGASIYESSPLIARGASNGILGLVTWLRGSESAPLTESARLWCGTIGVISVWVIGGLVALVGAVCYAELSTAFPHQGGNYYFLKQAFGPRVGFAFAWVEFWIVRPGNVGAVAFVFANYAAQLVPALPWLQSPPGQMVLAAAAIIALTLVNLAGIRTGVWTQNALTASKVIGLLAIISVALTLVGRSSDTSPPLVTGSQPGFGLALILVMFAYGGWSDMSYIAADVKHPEKNIFRSLVLGASAVSVIYILVNLSFVAALSLPGLIESNAVAADVLSLRLGRLGAVAISLLICVSTLGAINGMLLAGSRVFYALGKEDGAFAWLGRWNERYGGPVRSLLVQSAATLGLVVSFGMYAKGFNRLVVFTGPFFWGFLLLIGIGFLALRARGKLCSTYRVPWYPLPPLLLCLACVLMTYAAADYAWKNRTSEGYWAVAVVASGLVLMAMRWLAPLLRPTADR